MLRFSKEHTALQKYLVHNPEEKDSLQAYLTIFWKYMH
jgi:hypothetical protein